MRPAPPTLLTVRNMVREANDAWEGGEWCTLALVHGGLGPGDLYWAISVPGDPGVHSAYGREHLPGDGRPCDATGIARRLLAAFRDVR